MEVSYKLDQTQTNRSFHLVTVKPEGRKDFSQVAQLPEKAQLFHETVTVERQGDQLCAVLSLSSRLRYYNDGVFHGLDAFSVDLTVTWLNDVLHLRVDFDGTPPWQTCAIRHWLFKLKDSIGTCLFKGGTQHPHDDQFVMRLLIALVDMTKGWDEKIKADEEVRKQLRNEASLAQQI